MNSEQDGDSEIVIGRPPSKESLFYTEWARETFKETISVLNNTLILFITLNTILISAYLGFLDVLKGSLSPLSWQVILPAVLMIISLIFSIIGIYPFAISVNIVSPDQIKNYKERRTRFKRWCLGLASVILVLGFIVLLVARISSL